MTTKSSRKEPQKDKKMPLIEEIASQEFPTNPAKDEESKQEVKIGQKRKFRDI